MSANQAVVLRDTYNRQALQSSDLIFKSIGAKAKDLKKQLPNGRIAIEIGIETQEDSGRIFRVAAIALENNIDREGKLRVNISVHKYEETGLGSRIDYSYASSSALSSPESAIDAPMRYEIAKESMEDMKTSQAEKTCPIAWGVVNLLKEKVFPDGIPLPRNAHMVKCHLVVMTYTTSLFGGPKIECLASHERFVGRERIPAASVITASKHRYEGSFIDPGFTKMEEGLDVDGQNIEDSLAAHFAELSFRFEHMTLVAQGNRLPSSIPANSKGISASAQVTIEEEKDSTIKLQGTTQLLLESSKK